MKDVKELEIQKCPYCGVYQGRYHNTIFCPEAKPKAAEKEVTPQNAVTL